LVIDGDISLFIYYYYTKRERERERERERKKRALRERLLFDALYLSLSLFSSMFV